MPGAGRRHPAALEVREADVGADVGHAQVHAHQGGSAGGGSVHYKNCDAAKAAGAAPIRRGQPGYGKHLDRDNDGIACDK